MWRIGCLAAVMAACCGAPVRAPGIAAHGATPTAGAAEDGAAAADGPTGAMTTPVGTEEPWQPADVTPEGPPLRVAGERPERCSIRVTAGSIRVDGEVMGSAAAIRVCQGRKAALAEVDPDAVDRWRSIEAALTAARIPILMRGEPGPEDCSGNPLVQGCR